MRFHPRRLVDWKSRETAIVRLVAASLFCTWWVASDATGWRVAIGAAVVAVNVAWLAYRWNAGE